MARRIVDARVAELLSARLDDRLEEAVRLIREDVRRLAEGALKEKVNELARWPKGMRIVGEEEVSPELVEAIRNLLGRNPTVDELVRLVPFLERVRAVSESLKPFDPAIRRAVLALFGVRVQGSS